MSLFAFAALILYLGTIALLGAALLGGLVAWRAGRPEWARGIALTAAAWLALYAALLVGTSLASGETILPPGVTKRFCGVYLDCHLGIEVVDERRVDAVGPSTAALHPSRGQFLVVAVRVSSDARQATLPFREPRVVLRDADGNAWRRDPAAERALALEGGGGRLLAGDLTAGSSYSTSRLPERWSERFLIGDSDSWLHAPTTLALP
jgi:hypothetical protein